MREELITAFVTLFVVVDPLGLAPVFISLTRGFGAERRQIAVQASLIAFAVLAGAALIGDWLLRTLGIGLPAFRIAGGLLLFAIAFEQVFGRRQERRLDDPPPGAEAEPHPAAAAGAGASIAAFPLAIPLMAGPGAIAACVLLAEHTGGDPRRMALLFLIIAAVVASCYAAFLASPQLERVLGKKGEIVFARLLGVLLAALAVQYVVDGILAVRAG